MFCQSCLDHTHNIFTMGAKVSAPEQTNDTSTIQHPPSGTIDYVQSGTFQSQGTFTVNSHNYLPTEQEQISITDFTLLKRIGKGTFGTVLLARKKSNNKVYALKMLQKRKIIKSREVEHTNTERKVLTQLVHPYAHFHLLSALFLPVSLSLYIMHSRRRRAYASYSILLTAEIFIIISTTKGSSLRNQPVCMQLR